MEKKTSYILACFLVLFLGTLGANRLGYSWAGGTGLLNPLEVHIYAAGGEGHFPTLTRPRRGLSRGQTISTDDVSFSLIGIGIDVTSRNHTESPTTLLAMAENTTIELLSLQPDTLEIKLIRGRLFVDHPFEDPLTITTNHTEHILRDESAHIVNYDFLETITVAPVRGTIESHIQTGEILSIPRPVSIHETEPVSVSPTSFSLDSEAVRAFYTWLKSLIDTISPAG